MVSPVDEPVPPSAQPIDRIVQPLERFLHVESASGVVLLLCAVVALAVANSPASAAYEAFWKTEIGFQLGDFRMLHSLRHWINDGLMAIFFFVVGLEVKRELVLGELRGFRRAALPVVAAVGGMLVPAGIYLALQFGQPGQAGWGIPMATDIAFVVGCMAILGRRVPHSFRVILLSLAIVDDIGAIIVIVLGYSAGLDVMALVLGFAGLGLIAVCLWMGLRSLLVYVLLGVLVWVAFHESGVHATIAGVLLGFLTPTQPRVSEGQFAQILDRVSDLFHGGGWADATHRAEKINRMRLFARQTVSPLEYLEGTLHPWVGFVIMPVFALANAGVPFQFSDLTQPIALAVIAGLLLGKPIGIVLFSWLAVRAGLASLPQGVGWKAMVGGGFLAGIGFTMALFIADLALEDALLDVAKIGVLGASLTAAVIGFALLSAWLPRPAKETPGT